MNFDKELEEFEKCRKEVLDLLKIVTKETEQEQWDKYNNEPQYHMVVRHLVNAFMIIRTNKHFKRDQEELDAELQQMFKTHCVTYQQNKYLCAIDPNSKGRKEGD